MFESNKFTFQNLILYPVGDSIPLSPPKIRLLPTRMPQITALWFKLGSNAAENTEEYTPKKVKPESAKFCQYLENML